MRILPLKLMLLNLADRIPEKRMGHFGKEYAYERLKEASGEDFGDDLAAWITWYNTTRPEGSSRVSMKILNKRVFWPRRPSQEEAD